jgi:hypothetical protein
MIFALLTAQQAGLDVGDWGELSAELLAWLDARTNPATGLVAHKETTSSTRAKAVRLQAPPSTKEALSAAALVCRVFLGQSPNDAPVMSAAARSLLGRVPVDGPARELDPGVWYFGSVGMFQMGGTHWQAWRQRLPAGVVATQRKDGHLAGSWDPSGHWGSHGGRIYATAMTVLALEVHHRFW